MKVVDIRNVLKRKREGLCNEAILNNYHTLILLLAENLSLWENTPQALKDAAKDLEKELIKDLENE